jgi:hypothetical protein
MLANKQFAELLPAIKYEVTFVVEPITMLQGAEEHPPISMDKELYSEPVIKQIKKDKYGLSEMQVFFYPEGQQQITVCMSQNLSIILTTNKLFVTVASLKYF